MARYRKTRIIDWVVISAVFLLGVFVLVVGDFSRKYGTTPESELIVVTGPAMHVAPSGFQGVTHLRFTIEGQTVDYSSGDPGFGKVVDAIQHETPMTIGVSTKRETLFPRNGWVPLYSLSIGGQTLLTYDHTVTKGYRTSNAPFIIAGALLLLSGWGLYKCYRNRNASPTPMTAQELAAAWNDPKRTRTAAILFSVAIYAAIMFAMLHPDSMATSIKVFGESPLGMPLRLFIVLFFTLLLLPMPVAAWNGYRLLFRHASEGGGIGKSQILRSLFVTGAAHPDLKRSRLIVLSILAFYLALLIGWIMYADSRGI